jgi:hypothetical protein
VCVHLEAAKAADRIQGYMDTPDTIRSILWWWWIGSIAVGDQIRPARAFGPGF